MVSKNVKELLIQSAKTSERTVFIKQSFIPSAVSREQQWLGVRKEKDLVGDLHLFGLKGKRSPGQNGISTVFNRSGYKSLEKG
ncbi:hypothetical protein FZC79_16750 [Rossellomorea vietnamensis]|uniref:Uncharacterized protein n=1 Tax=Rossellomorea vietnamensis TaxID=218284 RepID=A0A5D4KB44_9BACI|nr:hypothetical protein [Rossellomorea vietnamensis]TYR74099.1 hypothetical protein FZC79_16750 [Rossellomorea vietnamensis]